MARRKRTSGFEAFIELAARMPWWAGVALALVSYLVLHRVAAQPYAASITPDRVPEAMFGSLWGAFALVGQYLVPVICLLGAGLSA